MTNVITGLDVGSSQLKGVVAQEKRDGTLSIIHVFKQPSAGIRRGVLVDVEEATCVLRDCIVDLQKISKRATENIFVNVASEHIKTRTSRGIVAVARADQEIQQDDIERVIHASRAVKLSPNYLVLHNIIREYIVDEVGDIQDPLGMSGNRLEVNALIVEAFAPQVNLLVKTLERVGGRVGGLIFTPLASARSVLSKRQRDLGVVVVDFGFGTTSFAVYEENKILHTKSIPLGSGYITNDIAIGFKTSIDLAEKLKLTYGFASTKDVSRRDVISLRELDPSVGEGDISKRFLAEIIEVRLAEICDLVNNELKSLGRSIQLPAGVVLTGGGVKLAGMTELVRQETKLPVQIGLPDVGQFEISDPVQRELVDDPEFATAVGLVLWGCAEEKRTSGGMGTLKNFLRNLVP